MNTTMIKKILIVAVPLVAWFFVIGVTAHAGYQPLEPSIITKDELGDDFGTYFKKVYQLGVGLAGLLAVLFIVIGGFEYMSTEAVFAKSEAKKQITDAIIGLLLALGSWLIMNTIDSDFVNFNLTLPNIEIYEPGIVDPYVKKVTEDKISNCIKQNTEGLQRQLDACPETGDEVQIKLCQDGITEHMKRISDSCVEAHTRNK